MGPVPAALQLCAGQQHEEAHPVTQVNGLTLPYNELLSATLSLPVSPCDVSGFLCRRSFVGGTSSSVGEADLNRLHAATSLMQIDDSVMRWGSGGWSADHVIPTADSRVSLLQEVSRLYLTEGLL